LLTQKTGLLTSDLPVLLLLVVAAIASRTRRIPGFPESLLHLGGDKLPRLRVARRRTPRRV